MTLLLSALLACPRHRHLNVFAAHRNQVRTCFCPHLLGRKSGISNHGCRNGGGGDDDDDDDDEGDVVLCCWSCGAGGGDGDVPAVVLRGMCGDGGGNASGADEQKEEMEEATKKTLRREINILKHLAKVNDRASL